MVMALGLQGVPCPAKLKASDGITPVGPHAVIHISLWVCLLQVKSCALKCEPA